jgi:hypothetical protein
MSDLVDRLATLGPPPTRDLDLAFVRTRATGRRRRRTAVLGATGVVLAVLGGLGVIRLVADDPSTSRVIAAGDDSREAGAATALPASWGSPIEVLAGGEVLFVHLDARIATPEGGGAGIARVDPGSGDVTPVVELTAGSGVAFGADSFWVADPDGRWLDRLDATTGERRRRYPLVPDGIERPDGPWRVAVGTGVVWAVDETTGAVRYIVLDGSGANGYSQGGGPVLAGPVAIGDEVWLGEPTELVHLSAVSGVLPGLGSAGPRRITALADGGDRLWVATSAGAGAAATVGYLPTGAGSADGLVGAIDLDGGVESIGAVGEEVCVRVGGVNTDPGIRCGDVPDLGAPAELDRVVDGAGATDGALVGVDGSVWTTRSDLSRIVRIDPQDGSTEGFDVLFDLGDPPPALPADGPTAPIGPVQTVAAFGAGGDTWSYEVWETEAGICDRVTTRRNGTGSLSCRNTDEIHTLSVGYRDGRFGPFIADAATSSAVAEVRFHLRDGRVLTVPTVDVGLSLRYAVAVIPDAAIVERAVAVGFDGQVLAEGEGSFGVPD